MIYYGWALKKAVSKLPERYRLENYTKGVQRISISFKGYDRCDHRIKLNRDEGLRIHLPGERTICKRCRRIEDVNAEVEYYDNLEQHR